MAGRSRIGAVRVTGAVRFCLVVVLPMRALSPNGSVTAARKGTGRGVGDGYSWRQTRPPRSMDHAGALHCARSVGRVGRAAAGDSGANGRPGTGSACGCVQMGRPFHHSSGIRHKYQNVTPNTCDVVVFRGSWWSMTALSGSGVVPVPGPGRPTRAKRPAQDALTLRRLGWPGLRLRIYPQIK